MVTVARCVMCSDCRQFTDTALGLSLTILNSLIDLVSFSGILYSIYPPLFAALLTYSVGGTVASVWLGKVSRGLEMHLEGALMTTLQLEDSGTPNNHSALWGRQPRDGLSCCRGCRLRAWCCTGWFQEV